jgi:tetratricopeptide (TPR) repeat protein
VELLRRWLADHAESLANDDDLLRLKDESERLLVIDLSAAELLADALVSAATRYDNTHHTAFGLIAQGDVRRAEGRYAEAVELLDAAGEAFLSLHDEIGWARSRTGWVFASQFCGHGRDALPVAERAYAILAGHDEHLRAGSLSVNTAGVHYQLGEYQHALLVYDRAIWHFRQVGPALCTIADERIAKAMANKALSLILLGQFELAIDLCRTAHDIFIRCGEVASALRVDHFRASIYAGQGQYTRALRAQADALAAFERAGLEESAIEVMLDMIDSQAGLNRHSDALALAKDLIRRVLRSALRPRPRRPAFVRHAR